MAQEPQTAPEPGHDPSMEDILASIRRILNEDEAPAQQQHAARPPLAEPPDVLVLNEDMMEPEPHAPPVPPAPPAPPAPPPSLAVPTPPPATMPAPPAFPAPTELVAPEAADAAANSVSALMRTLVQERSAAVHRGGPTIEDLVRDEMRPILKEWLDLHLPPLVERLVRAEIERVVGRAAP